VLINVAKTHYEKIAIKTTMTSVKCVKYLNRCC